jgi:hypothetical protein
MRVHIYVSFHVKVLIPYHFKKIYHAYYDPLLKRLHQARKVSGHVFAC